MNYIQSNRRRVNIVEKIFETERLYVRKMDQNDLEDLKEIHHKDKETSDDHSPLSEALDIIEEFEQASGALKKTLVVLGRQLDMNIPKMDPCDLQAFTNLIEKYSNVYKRQIAGRGKSKR